MDAALDDQTSCFPVVLLSHGTGGTAASLGWLAHGLAAAGYVVLGVDHHGNTASEPYRAEGFLCWWERPRDLTVTLDTLAGTGPFVGRLDLRRVACIGFSLGGYTALSILGAITDMRRFQTWAGPSQLGAGPREFPDLVRWIEPLMRESTAFRASWERHATSTRDARVRAAVALAPAAMVRAFTLGSLAAISVPVSIMVGGADREAPARPCSAWLASCLPNSRLHLLGQDVGHYALLGRCTEEGRRLEPEICNDAAGVNRGMVHETVLRLTLSALDAAMSG